MTPASASRSASSSSESSASCAGTPMMIWFVTVPEPAKEVMNSTRSPVRCLPVAGELGEDGLVHRLAEDAEAVEDDGARPRRAGRHGQPGPERVEEQGGAGRENEPAAQPVTRGPESFSIAAKNILTGARQRLSLKRHAPLATLPAGIRDPGVTGPTESPADEALGPRPQLR